MYPAKHDVIDDGCRHYLFVADSSIFTRQLTRDGVSLSLDVHSQVSRFAFHSDDDVPVNVLLEVGSERKRQKLTVTTHQTDTQTCYQTNDFTTTATFIPVNNTAARLVCHAMKADHIAPVLKDLHWLQIQERIQYKQCVLAFKCQHSLAPSYLSVRPTSIGRSNGAQTSSKITEFASARHTSY